MNWLAEHLEARRAENASLKALEDRRDFAGALRQGRPAVIAELKFRSPSKGELRADRDVEGIAQAYSRAGASALSVLVDGLAFGGDWNYLRRARAACPLPLLAKGFFLDAFDLEQARRFGADAVLLIARAMERQQLSHLIGVARDLGLASFVELHTEADLAAVAGLEPDAVGLNHRDLGTLQMHLDLAERLVERLPRGIPKVAESGLEGPEELLHLSGLGFDAVLMGTRFMSRPDPGQELALLLAGVEALHAAR